MLLIQKARKFQESIFDKISPIKAPPFATAQIPELSTILPFEHCIEHAGRTLFVLSDGGLGALFELELTPHEVMSDADLERRIGALGNAFGGFTDPDLVFQVIFDSRPSADFPVPDYISSPQNAGQKIILERVKLIQKMATQGVDGLHTMRRRAYLCVRVAGEQSRLSSISNSISRAADEEFEGQNNRLNERADRFTNILSSLEQSFEHVQISFLRVGASELLLLLRSFLHSSRFTRESATFAKPYLEDTPLKDQVMLDSVQFTPSTIELGGQDTCEVLSWKDQSSQVYYGMMAYLLKLKDPIQVVVTFRPTELKGTFIKENNTKNATDAQGMRQGNDLASVQHRLAHGESLFFASVHVICRNVETPVASLKGNSMAQRLINALYKACGVPFLQERWAAPAVFFFCLPFCYRHDSGQFVKREKRVLSGTLGAYLPVLGGFHGSGHLCVPMLSRAGDAIWVSPWDTDFAAHVCVLAKTRGGKSFLIASILSGFNAAFPTGHIWILDKRTSYPVLAKVLGESGDGYSLCFPPKNFPNIFKGEPDEERLDVLVSLLCAAVTIVSPEFMIKSEHRQIIKYALIDTYKDHYLDASTVYHDGFIQRSGTTGRIQTPKLSNVVDHFVEIARKLDLDTEISSELKRKFGPFLGKGQFARIFDQDSWEEPEEPTPTVTLYDLEGVDGDPVLRSLTVMVSINEIIRQIKRPENIGKPGCLVVEELGLLCKSGGEELSQFIADAWKTLGKCRVACFGLTNEVRDYKIYNGARAAWSSSPTKLVLPLEPSEIGSAFTTDSDGQSLLHDPRLETVISSLRMQKGVYSQAAWLSSGKPCGSLTYVPTGYDYWLAASKPAEVKSVEIVKHKFQCGWFEALEKLAYFCPGGFWENGEARGILDSELENLT